MFFADKWSKRRGKGERMKKKILDNFSATTMKKKKILDNFSVTTEPPPAAEAKEADQEQPRSDTKLKK